MFSLQEEQARLQSFYWKFRFAFPDRPNPTIERSQELQEQTLSKLLRHKRAFEVRHPHPFDVSALFAKVREGCRS